MAVIHNDSSALHFIMTLVAWPSESCLHPDTLDSALWGSSWETEYFGGQVYLKAVSRALYCLAPSNWDDELGKCCVWLVFLQTLQDDHSSRKKHFPLYVSISRNAESVQCCSLFIIEKWHSLWTCSKAWSCQRRTPIDFSVTWSGS